MIKPNLFTIFSFTILLVFFNLIGLHIIYLKSTDNNTNKEKSHYLLQSNHHNFQKELKSTIKKIGKIGKNIEIKNKALLDEVETQIYALSTHNKKEWTKSKNGILKIIDKFEKSHKDLMKQNKELEFDNTVLYQKIVNLLNKEDDEEEDDDEYGDITTIKNPKKNTIKLVNMKQTYPPSLYADTKIKYRDMSKHTNIKIKTTTKRQHVISEIDQNIVDQYAKPFEARTNVSHWCILERNDSDIIIPMGLLYVRVPKTGSSTIAGVLQRLSERYGHTDMNDRNTTACSFYNRHKDKSIFKYRKKEKSYLIGSLRHPSKRAISRVFFQYISKLNYTPSDVNIYKFLHTVDNQIGVLSRGRGGFQMQYMDIFTKYPRNVAWELDEHEEKMLNMSYILETTHAIMDNYQFIFLNERLDECLVLFKFLLGISLEDILYLSSKVSSGDASYYKWGNSSKCIKLQTSFVSPTISNYLNSPIWKEKNYGDFLLYEIVNKSIDLTIDRIGKSRFSKALKEFELKKKKAVGVCAKEAILPCSKDGVYQVESKESCYFEDIGCGHGCLDRISRDGV